MENQNIQDQINDLNKKVDLILDHIHEQKQKQEVVEDLINDVSIVTNDAYKSTVNELEEQQIRVDLDEVKLLIYKFMRNIGNFSEMIDLFESLHDFMQDAGPILNEAGIDMVKKLHVFDQRGYFEYLNELYHLLGEIHEHYSVDDLKEFSASIGTLFNIMKNLTAPGMLKKVEAATEKLAEMKPGDEDRKSTFGLIREATKPDTRQALAFMLRVLREIVNEDKQKS